MPPFEQFRNQHQVWKHLRRPDGLSLATGLVTIIAEVYDV